jgi:hypothetical protein
MIARVDVGIGHVEKQSAAGHLTEPVEKLRLGQRALEPKMAADVLEDQWPATPLGDLEGVIGHELEVFHCRPDRIQVAQIHLVGARERHVLADPERVGSLDDPAELGEPVRVEGPRGPKREPHTVDHQGKPGRQLAEPSAVIPTKLLGQDLQALEVRRQGIDPRSQPARGS